MIKTDNKNVAHHDALIDVAKGDVRPDDISTAIVATAELDANWLWQVDLHRRGEPRVSDCTCADCNMPNDSVCAHKLVPPVSSPAAVRKAAWRLCCVTAECAALDKSRCDSHARSQYSAVESSGAFFQCQCQADMSENNMEASV